MFIERFNRTLFHIINKPMFINGDGNWVNILNDAFVTYNNNIHSTINMTPVDASNNPDKVKYSFIYRNIKPKPKVGDSIRNSDKLNIFSKEYTSNWNRELFKVNEISKTQPPTYKKFLKSELDFESNNKVLESLNINHSVKTTKMTRNKFNQVKQGSSNFSLSPSKARQLFLEDNDNIDLKDTYKVTNVHPPIDEKDVVNKEYCDNNILSSFKDRHFK